MARSGLTIDGVKAVVSSGFSRVAQVESSMQVAGIHTVLTDNASLKQEGGRSGRTCPGTHWIVGQPFPYVQRPDHPTPSIQTENIASDLLKIAVMKKGKPFNWYNAPTSDQLSQALLYLKEIEAIDENEMVTDLGKWMAKLPYSLEISKFLIACHVGGVLEEGAIVAAFMQNKIKVEDPSLELFVLGYEKGKFDDLECIKDIKSTIKESLNSIPSLPGITGIKRNPIGSVVKRNRLETLRKAVIYGFGHRAGIYIPTMLNQYNEVLKGDSYFTTDQTDAVQFFMPTMDSFYGQIVVPLDLFTFENRFTCHFAVMISMDELKTFCGTQAGRLQSLYMSVNQSQTWLA